MISGSKMRLDRLCKAFAVALALVSALGAAPAWAAFDLPELMTLLAKQKSGEARFTEQRFVHGLEGPLDASGTLSFDAPDKTACPSCWAWSKPCAARSPATAPRCSATSRAR
jgi:hypothetical protein